MLGNQRQDYNSFEDEDEVNRPPSLIRMVSSESGTAGAMQEAFRMMGSRRTLSVPIGEMESTFYCHICLTNKRLSSGYKLKNCGHYFCKPCLSEYLSSQFKSRQIHPRCFYIEEKKSCNTEIHPQDIKGVADSEAMKKYVYFTNKEKNPNFVDCPKCKTQQEGNPRQPWTVCAKEDCDHEFCFIHQNQHPKEQGCGEYEAQVRAEEKKNRAWKSQNTRKCPQCGTPTEKNEGCNHMTCYVCQTGWCWLCGQIIGNQVLPDHYKTGECKGKQFTSEAAAYMSQWEALCCVMLPAFFFLLFSPVAFVMAIVVFLISPIFYLCCCCPDEGSGNRAYHNCLTYISSYHLMLLITL